VTKEALPSDKQTLLSLIEDEVDTWIVCAIDRFNIQFIINVVRAIDEVSNIIDARTHSVPDAITLLLERLASATSSRSIFAELLGQRWEGQNNIDTWQDQDWRHISARYGECKDEFTNPDYKQVERFRIDWKPDCELILLPIFFDDTEQHLGFIVFQADRFEIGVEKALGQVEDLILDNLIQRMAMDNNSLKRAM